MHDEKLKPDLTRTVIRHDAIAFSAQSSAVHSRLSWLEKAGVAALLASVVVFAGIVQIRSAFLARRMGDWNVFTRAAWAVRCGDDLYAATDDNGFHYHYPPLFAILLAPLADAPAGVARTGLLPYATTVLYWYSFNVICLAIAAHWLATALETAFPPEAQISFSRRWWRLRIWPVVACLPAIGHTLMRGQVGILLLLLISGMILAEVRGRRLAAGCWLAGAICLKVIPGFLLIYPLLRRDWRMLAGCGLGLFIGLVAIPVAVRGPEQTWRDYATLHRVVISPSVAGGLDQSRAKELTEVTATDSQSLLAMMHNSLFLDRASRPRQATTPVRLATMAVSGLLLLAVLAAARGVGRRDAPAQVMLVGALVEIMLLASPVCHLHYFCLNMPLIAGLLAAAWRHEPSPRLGRNLAVLLALHLVANIIPHLPGMEFSRDVGLASYAALLLLGASIAALRRCRERRAEWAAQPDRFANVAHPKRAMVTATSLDVPTAPKGSLSAARTEARIGRGGEID